MSKDRVGQYYFGIQGNELVVQKDTLSVNADGTHVPFSDRGSRRLRKFGIAIGAFTPVAILYAVDEALGISMQNFTPGFRIRDHTPYFIPGMGMLAAPFGAMFGRLAPETLSEAKKTLNSGTNQLRNVLTNVTGILTNRSLVTN